MNVIKINMKDLPKSNNDTPVLSYCRKLIEDGVDPNTRLEVYRDGLEPDVICKNIGYSAQFTINGKTTGFKKLTPASKM